MKPLISIASIFGVMLIISIVLADHFMRYTQTDGLTSIRPAACFEPTYQAATLKIMKDKMAQALYQYVPSKIQKGIFANNWKNVLPYVMFKDNEIHNAILVSADNNLIGNQNWNGKVVCQGNIYATLYVPLSLKNKTGYALSWKLFGKYTYYPSIKHKYTAEINGFWASSKLIKALLTTAINKKEAAKEPQISMPITNK